MEPVFQERKRWKFLGLPWTFTKYFIFEDKVRIRAGFLSITEDDAMMYKIQDVRLTKSLCERIFHLATITCYTGDTTHPELKLIHIRHASEIKEYLITGSEDARIKRRTLHTLDIGDGNISELDTDGDGVADL